MSSTVAAAQRISDFQQLVNRNQDKIRTAGNNAWKGISPGSEVQRVHEFLSSRTAGNSLLNREVASLLTADGWVVKFAGIFLHQKPYVKGFLPDNRTLLPNRCELGDLQTLFVYVRRDKAPLTTRSVIFQAKLKPSSGSYDVAHPMQRQLYDDSPRFRYETVLPGETRPLPRGHNRQRALQYLFVNENPVTAKTIPSLKGHGAFATYGEHLLRIMNDSSGLIVDTTNGGDAWSTIVNDMITEFSKAVPAGKLKRQDGLQGILDPFNSFESRELFFLDSGFPEEPRRPAADAPGFGLQLIIVWDGELGDGAEAQLLSPVPQLQRLADYYDNSHYPDHKLRIQRKNRLVEDMARLIHSRQVDLKEVFRIALESRSQGMAAALARVVSEAPDGDWASLLQQLLPGIKWVHTVKLILNAILASAPEGLSTEAAEHIRQSMTRVPKFVEDPHVQALLQRITDGARGAAEVEAIHEEAALEQPGEVAQEIQIES